MQHGRDPPHQRGHHHHHKEGDPGRGHNHHHRDGDSGRGYHQHHRAAGGGDHERDGDSRWPGGVGRRPPTDHHSRPGQLHSRHSNRPPDPNYPPHREHDMRRNQPEQGQVVRHGRRSTDEHHHNNGPHHHRHQNGPPPPPPHNNGPPKSRLPPSKFDSYKLLIDPFIHKDVKEKVVRYDGNPNDPHGIVPDPKDPRNRPISIFKQLEKPEPMDLPVPRFVIDANYVGEPPKVEVTFENLNDNINKDFLAKTIEKFGSVESLRIEYHPVTNKHLGLARAVFKTVFGAKKCTAALQGKTIMGRNVICMLDPRGAACDKRVLELTQVKEPSPPPVEPHPPPPPQPNHQGGEWEEGESWDPDRSWDRPPPEWPPADHHRWQGGPGRAGGGEGWHGGWDEDARDGWDHQGGYDPRQEDSSYRHKNQFMNMHSQDDSYGWQGRRGRHKERGRRRQEPPPGQADWQPPPPSGGQFHPDPAHHLHHRPPHHLDPRADPRSRDSMDPRSRDNTDISLSSAREDSNAAAAGDAWLERESDSRFSDSHSRFNDAGSLSSAAVPQPPPVPTLPPPIAAAAAAPQPATTAAKDDAAGRSIDLDTRLEMLMKGKAANMPAFLLTGTDSSDNEQVRETEPEAGRSPKHTGLLSRTPSPFKSRDAYTKSFEFTRQHEELEQVNEALANIPSISNSGLDGISPISDHGGLMHSHFPGHSSHFPPVGQSHFPGAPPGYWQGQFPPPYQSWDPGEYNNKYWNTEVGHYGYGNDSYHEEENENSWGESKKGTKDRLKTLKDSVIRVVETELKSLLKKDINKKLCESYAYLLFDKWWAEQETQHRLDQEEELRKKAAGSSTSTAALIPDREKVVALPRIPKPEDLGNLIDMHRESGISSFGAGGSLGLGFRGAIPKYSKKKTDTTKKKVPEQSSAQQDDISPEKRKKKKKDKHRRSGSPKDEPKPPATLEPTDKKKERATSKAVVSESEDEAGKESEEEEESSEVESSSSSEAEDESEASSSSSSEDEEDKSTEDSSSSSSSSSDDEAASSTKAKSRSRSKSLSKSRSKSRSSSAASSSRLDEAKKDRSKSPVPASPPSKDRSKSPALASPLEKDRSKSPSSPTPSSPRQRQASASPLREKSVTDNASVVSVPSTPEPARAGPVTALRTGSTAGSVSSSPALSRPPTPDIPAKQSAAPAAVGVDKAVTTSVINVPDNSETDTGSEIEILQEISTPSRGANSAAEALVALSASKPAQGLSQEAASPPHISDHCYARPVPPSSRPRLDTTSSQEGASGAFDHDYTKPRTPPRAAPPQPAAAARPAVPVKERSLATVKKKASLPSQNVKFEMRDMTEKFKILYKFLTDGVDIEDVMYLKRSYEMMLNEGLNQPNLAWINDTHWVDHPVTLVPDPPSKKRRHDDFSRPHKTGCARTEGFYRMDRREKMRTKYHFHRPGVDAFNTAKIGHGNSQKPQKAISLSREARSQQRRMLTALGDEFIESDLLKFNQLKFRRKAMKFGKSAIHDWGLFAMEHIGADEMVIEYVGDVVRPLLSDIREKRYEKQGIGSSYLFRIDQDYVVDATKAGNLARFINHSCEPNCYAKVIKIDGESKIVIYSKQPIAIGEEITYDYKFPIEDEKIRCLCGEKTCRKYLN